MSSADGHRCWECSEPLGERWVEKSDVLECLGVNNLTGVFPGISIPLEIRFINDGVNVGFDKAKYKLLPVEERRRVQKIQKKIAKLQAWHYQKKTGLHPTRRCLYVVNEFSNMWLGTIDYMDCGHCFQLMHEAMILLKCPKAPDGSWDDWTYDIFAVYDEPVEDNEFENRSILIDLPILKYNSQRLWPLDLVAGEIFNTAFNDSGDGDGYYPGDLTRSRDEMSDNDGAEGIQGPDPVVCWRFFKSTCKVCCFQVADPPKGSPRHCLACYYFLDVLNQLVTLFCKPDCVGSKWNSNRPSWPSRCVEPIITDFNDYDAETKWNIIYQEGCCDAEEIMPVAQAHWDSVPKRKFGELS